MRPNSRNRRPVPALMSVAPLVSVLVERHSTRPQWRRPPRAGLRGHDEGAAVHRWRDASALRLGQQPLEQKMSFIPLAIMVAAR